MDSNIETKLHNFIDCLIEKDDLNQYQMGFNLFKTLGVERNECIHSKVIAYFLNPKENHGLGCLFINAFYDNILNIKVANGNDFDVYTERPDNIDIFAINKNEQLTLSIENKIDSDIHASGEYKTQLEKYNAYIAKNYPSKKGFNNKGFNNKYIFLSPTGYDSKDNNWQSISYKEIIDIFKIIQKNKINKSVNNFIDNYVELLEKEITKNSKIEQECQEIYNTHKDAIEFIMKHSKNDITLINNELKKWYLEFQNKDPWLIFNSKTKETKWLSFRTEGLKYYLKDNYAKAYFYYNSETGCLILEWDSNITKNVKEYCEMLKNKSIDINNPNKDSVIISKLINIQDLQEKIKEIIKIEKEEIMKEKIIKIKSEELLSKDYRLNENIITNIDKDNKITFILGRPGTGKSTMSLIILNHLLISNKNKVLFISLDISKQELKDKLILQNKSLNYSNLIVNDKPAISVEEIEDNLKTDNSIKTIVIDYLQLIVSGNENNVISKLEDIKNKFKVNMIIVSQLPVSNEIDTNILSQSDNIILIEK